MRKIEIIEKSLHLLRAIFASNRAKNKKPFHNIYHLNINSIVKSSILNFFNQLKISDIFAVYPAFELK